MKKIVYLSIVLMLLTIIVTGYLKCDFKNIETEINNEQEIVLIDNEPKIEVKLEETIEVFSSNLINLEIEERIHGKSWKDGAPIEIENLRYLQLTYLGFDNESHVGEMIVHKYVAEEVLEIFKELYLNKVKIEKMVLISEYDANDDLSMADNNTSAFCYRVVAGTDKLSKHSYGIAIDINPVQNPYVQKNSVEPESGRDYLDRSKITDGMIVSGDISYMAFVSRDWTWGGNWNSMKDYQHFQKNIDVDKLEK